MVVHTLIWLYGNQSFIQNLEHFLFFQISLGNQNPQFQHSAQLTFLTELFDSSKINFLCFPAEGFLPPPTFFFLCKYTSIMHYTFGWAQVNRCCTPPPPGSATQHNKRPPKAGEFKHYKLCSYKLCILKLNSQSCPNGLHWPCWLAGYLKRTTELHNFTITNNVLLYSRTLFLIVNLQTQLSSVCSHTVSNLF